MLEKINKNKYYNKKLFNWNSSEFKNRELLERIKKLNKDIKVKLNLASVNPQSDLIEMLNIICEMMIKILVLILIMS